MSDYNFDNFNLCPISFLPAGKTVDKCTHRTLRDGKNYCWVFDKYIPTDKRTAESCRVMCKKLLFSFLYGNKLQIDKENK